MTEPERDAAIEELSRELEDVIPEWPGAVGFHGQFWTRVGPIVLNSPMNFDLVADMAGIAQVVEDWKRRQ